MQTKRLGNTGLSISRLMLGTMTFGAQTDEPEAHRILDAALDAGINILDTANVYPAGGNLATHGLSEEIIGRWARANESGRRDRVLLATKAFFKMGPNAWDAGNSRKHLLDAIDASLKRLQTDHVDLYQLHADDLETPLEETLEALDVIVRSGRARYVGVANFMGYRLAKAMGLTELKKLTSIASTQVRYSLLARDAERELLRLASEENIGVITYNALAGGLLAPDYKKGQMPSRLADPNTKALYQKRYWNQQSLDAVDSIRQLADAAGLSANTLAIAWNLANPAVTASLVGFESVAQMETATLAADLKLDPALKAQLDSITADIPVPYAQPADPNAPQRRALDANAQAVSKQQSAQP